mmetsp:Transcript_6124/g.19341  ORF Transcript_6124/g.19341 Transcript_6124/m.19341 type:complete len:209 (+) Transcript_6124:769-1395(+)
MAAVGLRLAERSLPPAAVAGASRGASAHTSHTSARSSAVALMKLRTSSRDTGVAAPPGAEASEAFVAAPPPLCEVKNARMRFVIGRRRLSLSSFCWNALNPPSNFLLSAAEPAASPLLASPTTVRVSATAAPALLPVVALPRPLADPRGGAMRSSGKMAASTTKTSGMWRVRLPFCGGAVVELLRRRRKLLERFAGTCGGGCSASSDS